MTLSIKSIGGIINEVPKVSNLRVISFDTKSIDIEYKVEDVELTICRHYLLLNGAKKEITRDVGYESDTNIFIYKIPNLNRDTSYTIQIMASDGHDEALSEAVHQKTQGANIFGFRIYERNSNPSSAVVYTEGAVTVSPATTDSLGGWENKWPYNKIRIVGFKNGVVVKEIKKENKAQYIDGTSVGNDVDVMVEIPRIYWKTEQHSGGYEIKISDMQIDSSWQCYAHIKQSKILDYIYIGAYKGSEISGALRSVKGQTPVASKTIGQFRQMAWNRGDGYNQNNSNWVKLLRILFVLAFKTLNSKEVLGTGVIGNAATPKITGGTYNKGMVYKSKNTNEQNCFLGIEDVFGNLYEFVDGIFCNSNMEILEASTNCNFNDNHSGYTSQGRISQISGSGFIKTVYSTQGLLFLPKEGNGSESTFYCDDGVNTANKNMFFGGAYTPNDYEPRVLYKGGIFENCFGTTNSEYERCYGARLMYFK